MVKRALISVSDKTGVTDVAKGLVDLGYEVLSTGGTLRAIAEANIPVTAVDEITGFPEILDGRVKTLHPNIHGGLLAKRDQKEHMEALKENHIEPIDVVIVNLYPFKETLQKPGVSEDEIIENIDIGGPSMLRAAAKNFKDVLVIVDPSDYQDVLAEIKTGTIDEAKRKTLAAKVFRHTAHYDAMISQYFTKVTDEAFPENYTVTYEKVQDLRYGENPHQSAAFYQTPEDTALSLATANQLHGKALSYNNIQDANAAIEIVNEYKEPAAIAVKHMNPCGIGIGEDIEQAFTRCYEADSMSIFGGIVALNREVDAETAKILSGIFLEIIIAPKFSEEAFALLTEKKNIRLLELDLTEEEAPSHKLVTVKGGVLIQDVDKAEDVRASLKVVTKRQPTEDELEDLLFAWKAVKHVKSNAIVLAKNCQTIGIGAGQMNRVGAAKIATEQAGEKAKGASLASDAFFPMKDTVEAAAAAGITAIIQPGGSKRDQESIDACDEAGITMIFTGKRHFKH